MASPYTIKGLGQLEKRGPKTWRIRVALGKDPVTGKYLRSPSRTIHGTKADAIEALIAYKEEIKGGVDPKKAKAKVKSYAWNFHVSRELEFNSPLSFERETYEIKNIMRFFGDYYVSELDTMTIRMVYANIKSEALLSEDALHKMHLKLSQMMKYAVWEGDASRNPCDPIKMVRPEGEERSNLSIQEASRLDSLLFTTAIIAEKCAVMIALHTGIRRGEILGLTWKRIDFENNCMYVIYQYARDKKPRRTKSRKKLCGRYVSFDDDMKAYLLVWKELQARLFEEYNAYCIEKHHAYGPNGKLEQTGDTPIITNRHGGYYDPNIFSRWFRNFCVENGFGEFTKVEKKRDSRGILRTHKTGYVGLKLHELRHTQTSLLSDEGIDLVTVMHRLGHKDIQTTMGYLHRATQDDVEASKLMGELLSSGESRAEQLMALYPTIELPKAA